MKKQWRLAIGAIAATSMLLAGCSTGSEDKQGSGDQVVLTYWDFLDPSQDNPRSKSLKENIANFEAANPEIKIELSVVSLGDMLSRLPQAAAAGQAPDVFKMFSPTVPQMAEAGAYSPLPAAANEITDWLRPIDSLAGPDGQQVAVPYEYRTCALYYNESILEEIGASVPTTYDEVVETALKASAAGYTGFGTGFSDSDNSAIMSTFFDCFMSQHGQSIWNDQDEADYANDAALEFGEIFAALRDGNALGNNVVSDTYGTVSDGMVSGTVALSILGTERVVGYSETNPDLKWTALPLPSDGGEIGSTFGWTMGIGAGSDKVDAAWKFIEYMTGPEAGSLLARGGEVPTRSSAYEDAYFSSPEGTTINIIGDYVESNSEPHRYSTDWIGVAGGLSTAGQSLYLNGISGSDFLELAQETANK